MTDLARPISSRTPDLDGSVEVPDFNAWNANKFTSSLQWDEGDFTGDGVVNIADFNAWNNEPVHVFGYGGCPRTSQRAVAVGSHIVLDQRATPGPRSFFKDSISTD